MLYVLNGVALPPNAEDVIVREVPSKTKFIELLKISNWLQQPQKLLVDIECTSREKERDERSWDCSGLKHFDLQPLAEKEYKLNFFSYKPGTLKFKVKKIFPPPLPPSFLTYIATSN